MTAATPRRLAIPEEVRYSAQLDALRQRDEATGARRPTNWKLSPRSVVDYMAGLAEPVFGVEITTKYWGQAQEVRRLMTECVAALMSKQALMLVGDPGTAKSTVSAHLAAAISGNSRRVVQFTSRTTYGDFLFAMSPAVRISLGAVPEALVPGALMRGMQAGEIVRLEEITRATTAIQDGLISPFSERFIAVPELDMIVEALQGFNCILTANYADKGTQELSAALERRVCMKRLPSLPSLEAEIAVVARRSQELLDENPDYADIRIERNPVAIAAQVVRELREKAARVNGAVVPLSRPDSTLSPAETIDAAYQGALLGAFFGNGQMTVADIAPAVRDVVVKGSDENAKAFNDYVSRVAQQRARANPLWKEFAEAIA